VEAIGQNERVRHGGRRDPFRKDLALSPAKKDKDAVDGIPVKPVDTKNMGPILKDIENQIEELKKAKDEKRDDEGQKIYDGLILVFSTIRQESAKNPLAPV